MQQIIISQHNQNPLKIDDIQKISSIGSGSFGEVHLVRCKTGDFAMKELDKKQLQNEKKLYQVMLEKEILKNCNHPNIIKLDKSFQDSQNVYFILEYCKGGSLTDYIKSRDPLQFYTIQYYVASIIQGLQYLHQNGILHLDLKPDNIMLDQENKIRIIDFGTAHVFNTKLITKESLDQIQKQKQKESNLEVSQISFVGTSQYVSPEMLNGESCGIGADIWALGIIIYQLFTKNTPFYDQTDYCIFEKIKKLNYTMNNNIPQVAQDLIQQILVLNQFERIIFDENYDQLKNHSFFQGIDFENFNNNIVPIERKRIMDGIQKKKCGYILYKPRKLIIYEIGILEYYDPDTNELKGTINLKNVVKVDLINENKWTITIPSRVYYFKSYDKDKFSPSDWVNKLQSLINSYYL